MRTPLFPPRILIAGITAVAAVLLAAGLLVRTSASETVVPVPRKVSRRAPPPLADRSALGDVPVPDGAARPERPLASGAVAEAVDNERVRSTFQNYRSAIATGNDVLASALKEVLRRDRAQALRWAQEALATAADAADREISRRTLDSLR